MLVKQFDIFADFTIHFGHDLMQEIRVNMFRQYDFWPANDELLLEIFDVLMLDRHEIISQQRSLDLLKRFVNKPRFNKVKLSRLNIKIHVNLDFFNLSRKNFVDFYLIYVDFNVVCRSLYGIYRLLDSWQPIDVAVGLS